MSTTYRSNTPNVDSSSEADSDDVEEDTPLWRKKQEKFFRKQKGSAMVVSSSPTLPEMRKEGTGANATSNAQRKRKNNIWGSVLTEQDLTQTLVKSGSVETNAMLDYATRNVESYDFTKKFQDDRPDLSEGEIEEGEISTNQNMLETPITAPASTSLVVPVRPIIGYEDTVEKTTTKRRPKKRKADDDDDGMDHGSHRKHGGHSVKDRLGGSKRPSGGIHDRLGAKRVATTQLGDLNISEEMEAEEIAKKIAEFLHEPKVELIAAVVEHMSKAVAIKLTMDTKDIEEGGGMLTMDGSRRRTPGGVYLQLLKQQPEFTNSIRKLIFQEDEDIKAYKEKRKKNKKKQKEKLKAMKRESKSGSRSNSRSRSPKLKGSNSGEEEMDDSVDQKTDTKRDYHRKRDGNSGDRKHRSRSDRFHQRKYQDYDKDESESAGSDAEYGSRHSGRNKAAFNFEEELALAKKKLLERVEAEKNKMEDGDGAMEMVSTETGAGAKVDASDLDEAEANVVDVPLEAE